jgi:hypothetical protein
MAFILPFLEEAGSYLLPKLGEAAVNFIVDQVGAHQPREASIGYMANNQTPEMAVQVKQPRALGTNVTSGNFVETPKQPYSGPINTPARPVYDQRPVQNTYQLGASQPYYGKKNKGRGKSVTKTKKSIDTMTEKELRAKLAKLRKKQRMLEDTLGASNQLIG